jgi:hypothetical protein
MNPSTEGLNASMLGKIIGYNNDSGMLYKTRMGLGQFKPTSIVVPKAVDYGNYVNASNTNTTLEVMNSLPGKPPDYEEGSKERFKVPIENQPAPFTMKGREQETYTKSTINIPPPQPE